MENQKNLLEDLANLFEHLGNTESTDNGVSYADISKGKLEAKKKYLEIVSCLEDKVIIELKKENNLLPIRELDAINSMMANIIKF